MLASWWDHRGMIMNGAIRSIISEGWNGIVMHQGEVSRRGLKKKARFSKSRIRSRIVLDLF
jgi:hypothetical protein